MYYIMRAKMSLNEHNRCNSGNISCNKGSVGKCELLAVLCTYTFIHRYLITNETFNLFVVN